MVHTEEEETPEETAQRDAADEQHGEEQEAEQRRIIEARRQRSELEAKEREAEEERWRAVRKQREAAFERILENAPQSFTPVQLRVLLRAIIHLDPYTFSEFAEQLASEGAETQGNNREHVLFYALDKIPDEDLSEFALRLALFAHRDIPHEGEIDSLAEAESAFFIPKLKKQSPQKQTGKRPTLVKGAKAKKSVTKKRIAA